MWPTMWLYGSVTLERTAGRVARTSKLPRTLRCIPGSLGWCLTDQQTPHHVVRKTVLLVRSSMGDIPKMPLRVVGEWPGCTCLSSSSTWIPRRRARWTSRCDVGGRARTEAEVPRGEIPAEQPDSPGFPSVHMCPPSLRKERKKRVTHSRSYLGRPSI